MSGLISKHEIIKQHNLIVEYHTGILDVDSFIKFKKNITLDPLFSPGLNYFVHLKNVTFNTKVEDIEKYIHFLKINSKLFGVRRVALITDTPNQVVSTTMFKMLQQNKAQYVEIFSTNEKALEWLNLRHHKNDILPILNQLSLL